MDHAPGDEVETTEVAPGVHLAQTVVGERMSVQSVYIEPGASVPRHSHPHEQTGYLSAGTLTFLVGASEGDGEEAEAEAATVEVNGEAVSDEEVVVHAGDSYVIPGDQPHAAVNNGEVPVEGVDVFSPPRENPAWQE
jgi:quercetin dioxygenase-like cupin family protein